MAKTTMRAPHGPHVRVATRLTYGVSADAQRAEEARQFVLKSLGAVAEGADTVAVANRILIDENVCSLMTRPSKALEQWIAGFEHDDLPRLADVMLHCSPTLHRLAARFLSYMVAKAARGTHERILPALERLWPVLSPGAVVPAIRHLDQALVHARIAPECRKRLVRLQRSLYEREEIWRDAEFRENRLRDELPFNTGLLISAIRNAPHAGPALVRRATRHCLSMPMKPRERFMVLEECSRARIPIFTQEEITNLLSSRSPRRREYGIVLASLPHLIGDDAMLRASNS